MAVLEKDTGMTWVTRETVSGFPTFTRASEAKPRSDQISNAVLNPGVQSVIDHLVLKSQLPEEGPRDVGDLRRDRRPRPEDPQPK